jgi:hypothetical protein
MMGHREKLKSGDEWDLLFWRPVLGGRGGRWKKAKNAINRRTRCLNKGKPLYEEWFPTCTLESL